MTTCLYCGATNVPTTLSDGKQVAVQHDDAAHGNKPCLGSGK